MSRYRLSLLCYIAKICTLEEQGIKLSNLLVVLVEVVVDAELYHCSASFNRVAKASDNDFLMCTLSKVLLLLGGQNLPSIFEASACEGGVILS